MAFVYDAIVAGVGSMGSATCYCLAAGGYTVLGLEQFDIPHEQGAHGGQSRIIRKAYFEHSDYVPLLQQAYQQWEQLEQVAGEKIFFKTGLLYIGPPGHPVIHGIKKAAGLYGIEVKQITAAELRISYPGFRVSSDHTILFEPDAGFVQPSKIVSLYSSKAIKKGAQIKTREKLLEWKKHDKWIEVITDKNTYQCRKLIITAGAWTDKFLPPLPAGLQVTRQLLAWAQLSQPQHYSPENFPCWMIAPEDKEGVYYGFPYLPAEKFGEPEGLKFAWHHPGTPVDPDQVNRKVENREVEELISQVARYLPLVAENIVTGRTCLYANSPDENFIIDHLPGYDRDVVIACGFSGHGFKFVPVVGQILTDLAMRGETDLPIGFLGLKRFQ